MPVGTQGTVKAMTQEELVQLGFPIILCNTYHTYLRPGHELIARAGGLHGFINWQGNILTDSGGFQVFSLQELRTISEHGVEFKSHLDGSKHLFTPERAVRIQGALGSDIMMAFDQLAANPCTKQQSAEAMERTHRWAKRCVDEWHTAREEWQRGENEMLPNPGQVLFGIVQGGIYDDLRQQSAAAIAELDTPGIAIGGVAVGEEKALIFSTVEFTTPLLPDHKPRYLMGVGEPEDILHAVSCGVDMFDCVLPTRLARNAAMMTHYGRVNLRNSKYKEQFSPVDDLCDCQVCQNYTAAYIHHLFQAKEILAARLATFHNLYFLHQLMADIRKAIRTERLDAFAAEFLSRYQTAQ